jgi:hypothetical protein
MGILSSVTVMRGLREDLVLGIPKAESIPRLRGAANELRDLGHRFLAGYVLGQAIHCAWGDADLMQEIAAESFSVFLDAVQDAATPPLEVIAALKTLSQQISLFSFMESAEGGLSYAVIRNELGQRLAELGSGSIDEYERDGFLVRGFQLEARFDGTFSTQFPNREVLGHATTVGADYLSLEIESAFRVAIDAGDYLGAFELAAAAPTAFTRPGLLGWKSAVEGLADSTKAAECFARAADEFARDVHDPDSDEPWSSINVDLWAKYFRAREAVALIGAKPESLPDQARLALAALEGTESGWVNPQVTCFRVLLLAVSRVLADRQVPSLEDLRAELDLAGRIGGGDISALVVEFLDLLQEGLQEVLEAPDRAFVIGTLPRAIEVLRRVPLFEEVVRLHVRDALGERALSLVLDQQRTWIHRTLESVTDEAALQHIVLRLLQAGHPHYAQIRHGPLEYGKDVVALIEVGDGPVLDMYQAKVGDISLPQWRKVKPQLEEMFEVDVEPLQLPVEPTRRNGILIFNGHVLPTAEPAVAGWQEDQRDRGREVAFMHLDAIVEWIVMGRLIGEFRSAANEVGVSIPS